MAANGLNLKKRKLLSKKKRRATHCAYCGGRFGSESQKTLDHVRPISRGGSSETHNIAIVCKTCNQKKGDLSYTEFRLRQIEKEFE